MALGSHSLENVVSMLRTKIREYTDREFGDTELEEELNMKQDEVFMMLTRDMKKLWYGMPDALTLALSASTGFYQADCPADFWDAITIKHFYLWNGITYRKDVKEARFEAIEEYLSNQFLTNERAYSIVGQTIYTTYRSTLADDTLTLFYIRTPAAMTDVLNFDLPNQFLSLVVILSTMSIVASLNFDAEAKQIALQMLVTQEQTARKAAGLPLQSVEENSNANVAIGMLPGTEPVGGSKGTRPITA